MNSFEMIQHPLDWLSLTGSMAGLDEKGRDSADQLLTMIGDLQFCKGDIRGTCAHYFLFIETEWFYKLCLAANIDFRKLQNYLLSIENEAAGELFDNLEDPQASFRFPKNEEQPIAALYAASGTQSEDFSENNGESESHYAGSWPSIQKPGPNRVRALKRERLA
jgi:hypothetical protein